MFTVALADLNIRIENKYSFIEEMCRDYLTDKAEVDFSVSVTDEEIMKEDETGDFGVEYLETLAVYRKIAQQLIARDGFLLHGVIMDVDGEGLALLARSGTGKSTHAALWLKAYEGRCRIINGDKPLVRLIDGEFYAYGTPWAGKEGIHINARVPLRKICFLERSAENFVTKMDDKTALKRLCDQVYLPKSSPLMMPLLDTLDKFILKSDFSVIHCNMDISAAKTAYSGVFGEES